MKQKIALKALSMFLLLIMGSYVLAAKPAPIVITGGEAFKNRVKDCLDLLKSQYPESYDFVLEHIGVISRSKRSGMLAWENPPRYQMSQKTANYSLTWCASTIAHDAYHSYLYKKHRPTDGRRTPSVYWADFAAERKAIRYQLRVAGRIGASTHEIDYLWSLDGTHADVNGDGTVTDEDYRKRDW